MSSLELTEIEFLKVQVKEYKEIAKKAVEALDKALELIDKKDKDVKDLIEIGHEALNLAQRR